MKKLFVAVLAIAALAACNKEEAPVYQDNEAKTIEISILNLVQETKALAGGDTAQGTPKNCAEFGELKVLFATSDGAIKFEDTLAAADGTTDDTHKGDSFTEYVKDEAYNNDGIRRWHNVPAEIKRIAVVRYEDTDFADGLVGKDLEDDILALAQDLEENIARPIETMVLYGDGELSDTGETHMVGESLFHVWKAEVNVAPAFARFEVRKIQCEELGALNNLGDPAQYDFDELVLKSLTWNYKPEGGAVETYEAPDFGATLFGVYDPADDFDYKYDPNTCTEDTRSNEYLPTNGAWSWNVLPGEFQDLTLDIDAYAYNYRVSYEADGSDRNFPLYVADLATDSAGTSVDNKFVAGNIYHINLIFKQENIKTADGICVEVVVTVNPWNVVERFPVYQN